MAALVDTNVLVYRFDPRFPKKQARATEHFGLDELLSEGFQHDRLYGRVRRSIRSGDCGHVRAFTNGIAGECGARGSHRPPTAGP